ncbi:MAG: hypothetical protein GY808_05780, partial [Gammaproteobacteria bacterium]|nr:hypothetical protein [Gammaproteobacteria bacterium]
GEAWVSFHKHTAPQESYLANDATIGNYNFTVYPIATGNFASADYKDNGMTWFSTNDMDSNFEVDRLFKSTDGGVSWTQTTSFLTWPADNVISNVEIYPHFNQANNNVEVFYHNGLSGASLDTSRLYWAKSSDLGDTWTFTTVYHEPYILANNVKYHNDNFGQLFSETDENGVTHMVFNGYGVMTNGISPDSVDYVVMDVGYWNSNMSSFDDVINLADSLHSRNAPVTLYANSNAVGSGNNMGNAFPAISIGANGVLAVIWEQGELAPGDTTLVIATGPTG